MSTHFVGKFVKTSQNMILQNQNFSNDFKNFLMRRVFNALPN